MIADVRNFAAPIMQQRQAEYNALAMQQRPTINTPTQGYNALQSRGAPGGDIKARVYQGLIDRGLPAHVAAGFLPNMQDESGFRPGVNEAAPIVPGSRGGFGLYQLTGPRRREYEAFADQRGVDYSDVDAQLDFLVSELQGSEKRAADRILSTETPQDAAAAIVTHFLRPAEQHRNKRVSKYRNMDFSEYGSQAPRQAMPMQIAGLDDLVAIFGL